MTKEEALYKAKHLRKVHPSICIDAEDFWDTVIAALKQEPCTDAISRQAVLEVIKKCHCEEWVKAEIGAPIEALSSVAPAEKVGQWIPVSERLINEYISKVGCCDECFASVYCTVNGLRESRVPQDYCVKNIERYFSDKASPTGAEGSDKE